MFDRFFAFIGFIVLLPTTVVVSAAIKLDSEGPIFYRGRRVGLQGKPFHLFKFRTMVHNAEKIGGSSTAADDTRITRIGKYLRKHKLDELPQLINVLKGEMSLVGPRPQVKWAVDLYTQEEKALLKVRPGITDYASLRFSNEGEILKGSRDPDRDYMEQIHPEKMRLSLEYIKDMSLKTDLKIIVMTLKNLLLS